MSTRILTALPVFNEESHISGVMAEVRRFADEILVVNDGSTDNTARILADMTDLHVLTHEANRGYGAALNSAFQFAIEQEYDVLVTIDCDGQHQPQLIPALAAAVHSGDPAAVSANPANTNGPADMVSGSRYLATFEGDSSPPEDRRAINRQITAEINQQLGFSLTDTFCGFKAFRVAALSDLTVTEFGYAMPLQVWVQAAEHRWNIVEFPVPLVYLEEERSFGGSLDDSRRRLAYYKEVIARELAASSARGTVKM